LKSNNLQTTFDKYKYLILFSAIALVYLFNMFIDIMEIDAAQYASISMEMSMSKSFLQVYEHGHDYLDKPPLLFWLSSLSFILLGISNFAYKLPSVLIGILGIYSTYRFAKLWYSEEKARLSALIIASCQALFLITNDVRTDTNLLGLVMFSIWQMSEYLRNVKWKNLILASVGIGGAMLAKGPVALIIPAAAFGTDLMLKRDWKNIFKPQWILLLLLVAIILIPMSYGLYTQFDLHPEKEVYGLKGPSGLRFYYWTQSFGRITGENYWKNEATHFYFLHTILWDFQPWILMFIPALILKIRKMIVQKFRSPNDQEFITLGGFVLVFIALSMSAYKLPHYIFVLFPLASIITADFIYELKDKLKSRIAKIQFGLMHIFWLLMTVDLILFFPPKTPVLPIVLILSFALFWFSFRKYKGKTERIFIPTAVTIISLNLLMATNFYPNLLKYQSTSQVGQMVNENKIPQDKFYYSNVLNHSLNFYSRRICPSFNINNINNYVKGTWIYIGKEELDELTTMKIKFKLIKTVPSFKVTALELPFLYAPTRNKTLKEEYLLELQ